MALGVTTNTGCVENAAPVVVGLFKHASDAHAAIEELRAQGFSSNQIGAAFRTRAHETSYSRTGVGAPAHESWWDKVKDAFAGEPTTDERRANTEGYARGDHEYDYTGTDFEGSLVGTGIPSDRAAYLLRSLESGGAIVTVRDAGRVDDAEQTLSAHNGNFRHEQTTDVSSAGSIYGGVRAAEAGYTEPVAADPNLYGAGEDVTGRRGVDPEFSEERAANVDYADRTGTTNASATDSPVGTTDRMQLFGEVLRIHKDRISRGEVRVHKDVVSEKQTIEVPVAREELVLERVAVDRNTPASATSIGDSQEIRVPLSEERVRVEKQPVLREEVRVGKREVSNVEAVEDTVRHEEVRVDSDVDTPKREVTGEELPGELRRHG
jgi:uncharacterized protein (TIGR02271 family)